MGNPLITVVTVCYNAAGQISRTVNSVVEQDWPSIEYVVVDGGSTDATMQEVLFFSDRLKEKGYVFRYVSEKDNGIYDAMNKGIGMANGEWICFMNAGDSFASPGVLKQLFGQTVAADIGVVYGNVRLVLDFGVVSMHPKPIGYLKKKMAFCHQAAFVRLEEMRSHPFNLRYRLAGDYDFFYQYWRRGGHFAYHDVDVADFESEEGASSRNRLKVNREYAHIHGVDKTLRWNLWFIVKCIRVTLKEWLYDLLPQSILNRMRERNYKRLQKRRLAHGQG